jgi:hypothetical protein
MPWGVSSAKNSTISADDKLTDKGALLTV